MKSQAKILALLFVALLALVIYIFFSMKIVVVKPVENESARKEANSLMSASLSQVDLKQLEDSYKQSVKVAMSKLEEILRSGEVIDRAATTTTANTEERKEAMLAELASLKIGLMDLRLPENLKDFHFDFVLVLTKVRSYLEDNTQEQPKNEALETLSRIKLDNPWLTE